MWEKDGRTWVAFGAYDKAVHFLDAESGQRILPDFPVGDIIKGSVTIDPDGFPILYTGGRDNFYRAIALDRPAADRAVEALVRRRLADAVEQRLGRLGARHRRLPVRGRREQPVPHRQAQPGDGRRRQGHGATRKLVFHAPGWDDELLHDIGDQEVSIENSVAISGNTVYFANSGGLVQGWDISGLKQGKTPTRVFRFWTGDDTDASIVIDKQGFLYVASEYQRNGSGRATSARS